MFGLMTRAKLWDIITNQQWEWEVGLEREENPKEVEIQMLLSSLLLFVLRWRTLTFLFAIVIKLFVVGGR
jgi:hypothetical protein